MTKKPTTLFNAFYNVFFVNLLVLPIGFAIAGIAISAVSLAVSASINYAILKPSIDQAIEANRRVEARQQKHNQ